MTRADNTHHLILAATARHDLAVARARAAIEALDRDAQPLTFTAVARAGGVSRGWLYNQPELRARSSGCAAIAPPRRWSRPHNGRLRHHSDNVSTMPETRSPGSAPTTPCCATNSPAASEKNERSERSVDDMSATQRR